MKMGRYEQAIASFQQSNDISRHNQTFLMLGKVYEMTGDTQAALEVYMEALECDYGSHRTLFAIQ